MSAARSATCAPKLWSAGPTALSRATGTAPRPASRKPPLPPKRGQTTRQRAAAKTGLREHSLALVDTVIAFHQAEAAHQTDWQLEVAHPTPAGSLIPDVVVLLADGHSAFVEIDRTMSYARLTAKLERYNTYRTAPPHRTRHRRPAAGQPLA